MSATGSEESRSLLIQSRTRPLPLGGESDPEADQDAAGPADETARQLRPPEHAAAYAPQYFRRPSENTIALSWTTTYHGYMTTWQLLKRARYLNPVSQLDAALIGGVVAG